jgi:quercetin dioxygenase-like cupin family protein
MEFAKQQPTVKAPADWFTGDVWFDVIHAGQEPSRMRANLVRFSPGARTHWHSHALGQALYVVSGTALIGTRDGTVFEAHPGETVTCPPGEEHWHGAVSDRSRSTSPCGRVSATVSRRPNGGSRSPTSSTTRRAPPAGPEPATAP